MKNQHLTTQRVVSFLTLLSWVSVSWAAPAMSAEEPLKNLNDPLAVELKSPLGVDTSKAGDAFETILTETYEYHGKDLPSGTLLKGQVTKVAPSRPFARPGYILLDVKQAVYPGGETLEFNDPHYPKQEKAIHHPKAVTLGKLVKSALPFTAVSVADSIPLKYAVGMSSGLIIPISLGARMLVGAVWELNKKEGRDRSVARKISYGMLRGTGLPGAYSFLKKSPAPNYQVGEKIDLPLDSKKTADLFSFKVTTDPGPVTTQAVAD